MTEKAPTFQSAFDKASVSDAPKAEPSDFSEYPESHRIIISELKARNGEMRKCVERRHCVFLVAYVETLLNRLKTLDEGTDPLEYLERKYGKDAYTFVKENRDTIDLKFDEQFTKWLLRMTWGRMLSMDNGFTKEEVSETYERYVADEALPELMERLKEAKSPRMKAFCEYGISFLLSDTRLISSR